MSGATNWLASVRHGGLFIAPSRLKLLRATEPSPLQPRIAERLRAALTRLNTGTAEAQRDFLDTVLEYLCDIREQDGARWLKGHDVSAKWSRRGATGETLKPRRLWLGDHEAALPVFVDQEARLGVGRGRRAVSRVLEWLRATPYRVALLTNHSQFRLIYAGPDYDAWVEWDTALWFEEGSTTAQVDALRWLIARETLLPPGSGKRCSLIDAIEESRKGQAELSASLGERVRRAVEELIQAYGDQLAQAPAGASPRDIYVAATRVVMRMVVILFAEARELLPRDNPRYEDSYGLQALRAQLDRATGASRQRRHFHISAWPRILSLFRLVHDGSHHPELLIRRYGGGLFTAGASDADDPLLRALAIFEDSEHGPNDETVARILGLLCRTEMRVRVAGGLRTVTAPVDFSDLSSEYIGILYEGLLDYELRRATADDPLVFLDLGDQPVLPLSRLETMSDAEINGLVEKAKKSRKAVTAPEDEAEDSEESDDEDADTDSSAYDDQSESTSEDAADDLTVESDIEGGLVDAEEDEQESPTDQHFLNTQRAHDWALRAVRAGGLVSKPRSRRPEVIAEYQARAKTIAQQLITRVIQPGEWFLVLWGGTRKGSGTFYTRPQLAVPTVHRTLRSLAYDPPASGDEAPLAEWTPKAPEFILALKVCDPAVGSGSFVVAALRFLSDALWRSILNAGWLSEDAHRFVVTAIGTEPPPWFAECVRDLPVTAGDAEAHIRARLRRVVVERCIYGVDLDPLAIELARLSLWVETMDRDLPFEFLDHRLKVGNALVGCWFDRFRDYPAMAWMREGGDTNHNNFVHHYRTYTAVRGKKKGQERHAGDKWSAAIKEWREREVKPALVRWITGQRALLRDDDVSAPEGVHDEAVALLRRMEAIPLHEPEERAQFYREKVAGHPAFQRLITTFDTWCALWFWPADKLTDAPLPASLGEPSAEALAIVRDIRAQMRFFHWELEFADVFTQPQSGFDAVIGNPPWETLQPNSKEFFSNIDPLYRAYGKQRALERQRELFAGDSPIERSWIEYNARFKSWVNWHRHAASPFGDPENGVAFGLGRGDSTLHALWREKRVSEVSYSDRSHPFRHQGEGKPYTYRMFVEQAYSLLRVAGRIGAIVPSGMYTDKGSAGLRALFLDHCRWEWLFGFENRNEIFDIHRSFKFGPVIVSKGGRTEFVRTAFMRRDLSDWEQAEHHIIHYPRALLDRFSPTTHSFSEFSTARDLAVAERIYERAYLVEEAATKTPPLVFGREFNMTDDSHLFTTSEALEAQGYHVDTYGRFRRGEELMLPLYQGVMIWQLDSAARFWGQTASGSKAWMLNEGRKVLRGRVCLRVDDVAEHHPKALRTRIGIRDVQNATNQRTMIGAVIPGYPCPHSMPTMSRGDIGSDLVLLGALTSFPFDWLLRIRMSQNHVSWFYLANLPLPKELESPTIAHYALRLCARLALATEWFSPEWLLLRAKWSELAAVPWQSAWAATPHERLRLRCQLDALVALCYGLTAEDLGWILRDCDWSSGDLTKRAESLDAKGFWRVDRHLDPELRHTVLALVALRQLEEAIRSEGGDRMAGISTFFAANDGEGWIVPESVCLKEYGLGHDERSNAAQPVRSRLGERFYSWQLEQSVEESWAECQRHARDLLGANGYARLTADIEGYRSQPLSPSSDTVTEGSAQKRLFPGKPSLFDDGTEDPV